jgi:hypothetical protein
LGCLPPGCGKRGLCIGGAVDRYGARQASARRFLSSVFAVAGILIAAILNWRDDKQGYWMNGTLIAFADIPFVLFALAPGLIPWWPGLVGPLFWLIAFMFTTVARFSADTRIAAGAPA